MIEREKEEPQLDRERKQWFRTVFHPTIIKKTAQRDKVNRSYSKTEDIPKDLLQTSVIYKSKLKTIQFKVKDYIGQSKFKFSKNYTNQLTLSSRLR